MGSDSGWVSGRHRRKCGQSPHAQSLGHPSQGPVDFRNYWLQDFGNRVVPGWGGFPQGVREIAPLLELWSKNCLSASQQPCHWTLAGTVSNFGA